MTTRVPVAPQQMKTETVEHLQELIRGLKDSVTYHREAATTIKDEFVQQTFNQIADERSSIADTIASFVLMADEKPVDEGSWLGSLRTIWTKFRGGLNMGDATVVLIEAERAEDVIVNKFKQILPQVAGNPVNDRLLAYFEKVKSGHDQVLGLRNAFQAV